jgi:nucleoside-diphosphate-sugar epimerase
MNLLITGGAGYIGLKLAQALLEKGHSVTVFDNFMYGIEPSLFLFQYDHIDFIRKDIRNIESGDIRTYDCIFHLAGISGYPACEANPHSAQMINYEGTKKLLDQMAPGQHLVYASTTSIYGQFGDECTEETPVAPASLYASTKLEAEKCCMQRKNSVALRFATIFGVAPRMRWDLMPNDFVMKAVQDRSLVLFDSHSVRTFLHIDDAVQAYLLTVDRMDDMADQVYNVGCREMNLSKRQLADKIKEQVEFAIIDSDLTDPDVRNFIINFDKIAALGFIPRKTLEKGIAELVKLYQFFKPTLPYRII